MISINKRLLQIVWPFIFMVIFLLTTIIVSMEVLSYVRGYVGGESQWSKGQKDATYYLNAYASSKSEADYQQFLQSIAIPLGDHRGRLALDRPDPDIESARIGFLAGKNHPDDIPGMIKLFVYFRHTPLMEKPIGIWAKADTYIARINLLAEAMHEHISEQDGNEAEVQRLLAEINSASLELTPIEAAFSDTMGEVSRLIKLLIDVSITLITVLLLWIGIVLSRRMVQRGLIVENELLAEQKNMRFMLENSPISVRVAGSGGRKILFANSRYSELVNTDREKIIDADPSSFYANQHDYEEVLAQVARGQTIVNKLIELNIPDKDQLWVMASYLPIKYENEQAVLGWFYDVTELRNAKDLAERTAEKLVYKAHYDELTGLPNRILFQDRLDQETKKSQRTRLPLALMFLDVDHFKEVNDTLGHDKGDILLRETAQRLQSCVRETDTVARFGGDEFVILLSQLEDLGSAERIAQSLLDKMIVPFRLEDELVYVSISVGITLYPNDATTHEELIKNADQAMYLAKKSGRNRFNYFTPSMQEAAQMYRKLANDMRPALAEQQYRVYYQPIVHLNSGSIHKAEALIRWQHPTRGLIYPAEFIPIAEETGMINDIGDWVFFTAARQAADWRSRFNANFQISVNKSPAQFQDHGRNRITWGDELTQLGLSGASIVVEITEGMLMETSESTKRKLLEFRDAGIQVALDDFGTGYSSLSYLHQFDIDYIKIDQSFVKNLALGSHELVLCEAIIAMAHKLGMQVIAEGVETAAQRELLLAAGCDYAQGYLFSKPVTAASFEALLQAV